MLNMGFQNCKYEDENAAYYRFTAYLKISIIRRKSRYMAKHLERQKQEISYGGSIELLNCIHGEDVYLSSELEDELLCRALTRLREHERTIVFRRAVSEESFIKIAADMGLKYVTVKAIYRRSLEKLRKEMRKK